VWCSMQANSNMSASLDQSLCQQQLVSKVCMCVHGLYHFYCSPSDEEWWLPATRNRSHSPPTSC
jgi:hypothetical protein